MPKAIGDINNPENRKMIIKMLGDQGIDLFHGLDIEWNNSDPSSNTLSKNIPWDLIKSQLEILGRTDILAEIHKRTITKEKLREIN